MPENQYHEQIRHLWNQKKATYTELIKKSDTTPYHLYTVQNETNNLLKYAGYSGKYDLIDDLGILYLQALTTLKMTDQYQYFYYPGSPRVSIHPLDRKFRMWLDDQKPVGAESILASSQFLYLLSDMVAIISGIRHEKRTPAMKEALNRFVPILLEHYERWIFATPGPFQVRGWGCRYDGSYVPSGMNHMEFIGRKLDKKLGNGNSPAYCNAITDTDLWIIAGVANILMVHQKEKALVPLNPDLHEKLMRHFKTGVKLIESRIIYTALKDFEGRPVTGALFDAGVWDAHPDFVYAGYTGKLFPEEHFKTHRARGVGWDLSHARRFVHVFATLIRASDSLKMDFPEEELIVKMANQLVYATFNRDFEKPLFTNFMDGTNGWYRVGYSGRKGFGYAPWDMSLYVFEGGYGFWSVGNKDIRIIFSSILEILASNETDVRNHVIVHYDKNHWSEFKRSRGRDFKNPNHPETQSVMLQALPSLCFMINPSE